MTQPSFEYLEDKKELRQVPDSYPTGGYAPGNYTCKCAICHSLFTGDKRAVHCEPCAIASLPTYPVTTPTEQWEREVRGRKDLKEGVEFFLSQWDDEGKDLRAYPIEGEVIHQSELKAEGNPFKRGMEAAEGLQKEMHQYIEMTMGKSSKVTYQDCVTGFLLWKIGELKALLNSDQESDRSVASKAK